MVKIDNKHDVSQSFFHSPVDFQKAGVVKVLNYSCNSSGL